MFWAGTTDGRLFKHDRDILVEETANTLAPPESIRSLYATPDGSLWIGYGGRGLGRLKGVGFVQYGTEDGLHDDYISHIVADKQGRFWFAGNRGIFYVKQSEFGELEAGQRTWLRSIVYGSEEGLPSLQASYGVHPGALLATNGNLLIPTLTGLASMSVDHLKQNLKQPAVVITRVVVDNRLIAAYEASESVAGAITAIPMDLGQINIELRLLPDHQRVVIEFTALNFTAPKNVSFRYRLKGLDRGWVEIGDKREVYYTHIQAGEYTFQVQACNDWGQWSDPATSFSLKVLPYYWQTWTFRILATVGGGVLIASFVAWLVRLRHRRRIEQLERQQAMDRERARIAQDLHDDLGSGLTEISFGSEFAQDPTLGLVETRQYTQEIGTRARELVAVLDEIVWAVNPKNDTVASLAASGTGVVTVASGTTLTANGNSSINGSSRATGGTVAIANNSKLTLANSSTTTTSDLSIGSGSTLAGTGGTSGQIKGSGLLSPGNSPGILTSGSVDLSGGIDFAFEFTAPGAPTYSLAGDSKNDLLHLTSGSTPFSGSFSAGNTVSFYFNDAGLSASLLSVTPTTYLGGFFVDSTFNIAGLLSTANMQYFIAAAGGTTSFNGVNYNLMSNEVASRMILSNVNQSAADFSTGTVNGTVLGVMAVPEPSSGSLLLAGIGSLLVLRRFRKKA